MKMNEKEINNLKSMILEFVDAFVDVAAEKGEKTVIVSPLDLDIDYENFKDNEDKLINLINDIQNTYNNDGYILDRCTISNTYNNGHELLFPTVHFSATINKIERTEEINDNIKP